MLRGHKTINRGVLVAIISYACSNSALAFDCLVVDSELTKAGLPDLPGNSCPISNSTRYANRILNQNFKVVGMDFPNFTAKYEAQLKQSGWSIEKAPFDKRADGQLAVITASRSPDKVADISIKKIVDSNSNQELVVRAVVSITSMSPEDQLKNQ